MNKPFNHTIQSDAWIKKAYATNNRRERKACLTKAAAMINATPKACYYRAVAIGAIANEIVKPTRTWCKTEIEIIEDNAHLSLDRLQEILKQAGYHRSLIAISIRIRRFGAGVKQARLDAQLYNANDVAFMLGRYHNTVTSWIEKGRLKAKKNGNNFEWEITKNDLVKFIKKYPTSINGSNADMTLLVDILTG